MAVLKILEEGFSLLENVLFIPVQRILNDLLRLISQMSDDEIERSYEAIAGEEPQLDFSKEEFKDFLVDLADDNDDLYELYQFIQGVIDGSIDPEEVSPFEESSLNEVKYFKKKKHELERERKKSTKKRELRQLRKKRKHDPKYKLYQKKYQKKYRRKLKAGTIRQRKHRR